MKIEELMLELKSHFSSDCLKANKCDNLNVISVNKIVVGLITKDGIFIAKKECSCGDTACLIHTNEIRGTAYPENLSKENTSLVTLDPTLSREIKVVCLIQAIRCATATFDDSSKTTKMLSRGVLTNAHVLKLVTIGVCTPHMLREMKTESIIALLTERFGDKVGHAFAPRLLAYKLNTQPIYISQEMTKAIIKESMKHYVELKLRKQRMAHKRSVTTTWKSEVSMSKCI